MDILENISDMLYNSDSAVNPFEPKFLIDEFNRFFDKHLAGKDYDEDFDNFCELNDLLDTARNIAFSVGFKTASKLWLDTIK